MNYEHYTLDDFLQDDDFIAWVRYPSPELEHRWKQVLQMYPDKQNLAREARRLILSLRFECADISDQEVRAMWIKLQKRHQQDAMLPVSATAFHWSRVAAIVGGGLLLLTALAVWMANQSVGSFVYRTAYGETKTIVLPDRSTVVLNANSSLRYAADWDSHVTRSVELSGEAFFTVQPTANHRKFIVRTALLDVEVLGTAFNVSQRRTTARVVLQEGKVQLHPINYDTSEKMTMQAGELAEVDRYGLTKRTVNPRAYTSWTHNRLEFDGTPVSEIAQLLEDNYGRQVIVLDSAIATKKFKGSAAADDVAGLLRQLEKVFQLTIEQKGQRVILRQNHRRRFTD